MNSLANHLHENSNIPIIDQIFNIFPFFSKMVAELDSYVAIEENNDQQSHYQQDDDDDLNEAMETLSLCDLPTTHGDDFSKEYQSSLFERDEDDFFEFLSEEFTTSENKDVIFCGKKLIPYIKEAPLDTEETSSKIKNKTSTKKWRLFRWRSFRRSKKPTKTSSLQNGRGKSMSFPMSKGYNTKCDSSIWKVSINLNRSKSKWHLFMFGITKLPSEMELSDIKSRQSRRVPSTMFRSRCEESDEKLVTGNMERISSRGSSMSRSSSSSNNRSKGLWSLLRVIGCSSLHRNSVTF